VHKVTAYPAIYDQKEPYSDEEIETILDGALKLNGGTHAYAKRPETFRCIRQTNPILDRSAGLSYWREAAQATGVNSPTR
jgi:hypothetical protein